MKENNNYSEIFKALSHPHRLEIVKGLYQNECSVTECQKRMHLPQSTISQHLHILKNAGIIIDNSKKDIITADNLIDVITPGVAKRFNPGNFAILITTPKGERIPKSIERGEGDKITMYVKRLSKTSRELDFWKVGDSLHKLIEPKGTPPPQKKYGTVIYASDFISRHTENKVMCCEYSKKQSHYQNWIMRFLL